MQASIFRLQNTAAFFWQPLCTLAHISVPPQPLCCCVLLSLTPFFFFFCLCLALGKACLYARRSIAKLCLFILSVAVGLVYVSDCVLLMQTQIVHLEDAHGLLDSAVAAAMRNSKPVYISVCCNLAGEVHPSFAGKSSCCVQCPNLLFVQCRV